MRSPNLSTNFPEKSPEPNLAIANEETIKPMAVLFTPNDFAKIGMAGTISPYPTATKKPTAERTITSFGRLVFNNFLI